MTPDTLAAQLSFWLDALGAELLARHPLEWLALFVPILLFVEVPRYHLPLVGLLLARWRGHPRHDARARAGILRRAPLVSLVIAGRNEGETIDAAIRSALDQDYPNFEVLVIDDSSEDDMHAIASRWARRGHIRLIRNSGGTGRAGRPVASNLGLRLANGEFLVSVDADTSFDRSMIRRMIEPFADPRVGFVAGNLVIRNRDRNWLTRMQALEYGLSISAHKRWTDLFGSTLQASGALGAFRRSALCAIGGWDAELAEDTDLSQRTVKAGYRGAFAPEAVAMTNAPERLSVLAKQRDRWDRGGIRTYFRKHRRLLGVPNGGLHYTKELWSELVFFVLTSVVYPLYLLWLISQGWVTWLVILAASTAGYALLSLASLALLARIEHRIERPWTLVPAALSFPFYSSVLRWVRVRAFFRELLQTRYEDSFLPDSAWANAPRF